MGAPARDDERQLTVRPLADEREVLAELAVMRRELVGSITDYIDFHVKHMDQTPAEALAQHRQPLPVDPAEREPEQVSWWDLERLLEADPEQGQALWHAIKAAARQELRAGARMARAVERSRLTSQPYERAQAIVILETLRQAMQPRDGLEHLLVQQMAAAYELHLRWQHIAVERAELDVWEGERDKRRALANMSPRERERYEEMEGWLPPRQTTAQAIEQAVLLADRYQRAFLRLLKQFRDTRKLIGMVVVGSGGTLNVANQQVNSQPNPSP